MKIVTLHFSESLVREAVRSFVFRSLRTRLGWVLFLLVVLLTLFTGYSIFTHETGWFLGFQIAMVLFIAMFLVMVYVTHYRNSIGRFRRMRSPQATFSYEEEQFTLASELGSATMPWSAISEVWCFPRFWLLLFSPAQFVTLPLEDLDEETQAFISRKTKSR